MTKLQFHHLNIEIKDGNGNIEMIPYRDIPYITYDKPYISFVYMDNGKKRKIILQSSLGNVEQHLPTVFFRCNPAAILNLCYFRKCCHSERLILMDDGKQFPVSRRKYPIFQEKLASLPRLSPLCDPCLVCTNVCPTKESFCAGEKNNQIAQENDQMV